MKKITAIVLSGTAALFLSACGGGGTGVGNGDTGVGNGDANTVPVDPMTEKDLIQIWNYLSEDACNSFFDQNPFQNKIMQLKEPVVLCETYERENLHDGILDATCQEVGSNIPASGAAVSPEHEFACIIGSDIIPGVDDGGGSSSGGNSNTVPADPMTGSAYISIIYNVGGDYCNEDLQNQLVSAAGGTQDYYVSIEENDVTCASYNRPIGSSCSEIDSGQGGPITCVTGLVAY